MEKKDMMYLAAALVLVLVIALVIKPLATGQTLKTGIPVPTTTIPSTTVLSGPLLITTQIPIMTTYVIPTTPPTPVPTWNPNSPKDVSFVDPSKYGVSFNQSIPHGSRFNESGLDTNMTTFATITSSTGTSGTTNVMYIPFPYWELVYTLEPFSTSKPNSEEGAITPTMGQDANSISWSGVSGSYSVVNPQFTIQVMDGDDPNRIVRSISPPGGINLDLWGGTFPTPKERVVATWPTPQPTKKQPSSIKDVVSDYTAVDPRPWTEKFYEGQRNYYFIVTTQSIASYKIEIKVPTRYIGKY